MDNGWGPVGIYWGKRPFKPPSEVHSPAAAGPDSTARDSLNMGLAGYFSPSQVYTVWLLSFIIAAFSPGVNSFFRRRKDSLVSEHTTAAKMTAKPTARRTVTGSP